MKDVPSSIMLHPSMGQVLVRRVNDAEALRWPWHRKFEQDEREGGENRS